MAANQDLKEALCLMQRALGLLDSTEMAIDAGAHLDLAIHRLEETLRLEHSAAEGTLSNQASRHLQ
jgi:hypothetical protein